jgi:tripartite-type tricarboxylate transporter receptor subunit TctC
VAKAQPDGYTVLLHGSGLWLLPFMREDVPWDSLRDFSPITLAISSSNLVVVNPSLPINSIKDLIAVAKARPGQLNDAGGQTGASTHLAAELFKAMAGVDIVRVPYKGVGPALNALIAGEVQLSFTNPGAATPHVKSGRLRALAVTSAQPSALLPGLPTVAASGLPGYEAVSIFGLFAPARTPAAIINRLNQESVRFLNLAQTREKFLNSGVETVGSSPEQLAATVKSEMARMGKVIRDRGIRAE